MKRILRRGLLLSFFLILTFTLISCDSGGSNNSPDWIGYWEVTEETDGNPPSDPFFLDLDEDHFTLIYERSDECDIGNFDVLERGKETVTLDIPEGTAKYGLEVSDGTLTLTVIESDDSGASGGDEATAVRIDNDPREVAGCS